jgi:hypothetical protein
VLALADLHGRQADAVGGAAVEAQDAAAQLPGVIERQRAGVDGQGWRLAVEREDHGVDGALSGAGPIGCAGEQGVLAFSGDGEAEGAKGAGHGIGLGEGQRLHDGVIQVERDGLERGARLGSDGDVDRRVGRHEAAVGRRHNHGPWCAWCSRCRRGDGRLAGAAGLLAWAQRP